MIITKYDYDYVKTLFIRHGYLLNEKEIVMFGDRNADWQPDKWNDTLGLIHGTTAIGISGTTKPGKSPLMRTDINENGVFILRPNFYPYAFHKGKHHGKYDALVQFGDGIFEGWRDNDKDGQFDISAKLWKDVKGLNFHTTRWDKQVIRVGDFSEGCQVTEVAKEFDELMKIVYGSEQALFSYALFQQ